MAAGLCKKYISEKFGCDVDRFEQIGYNINSAGVMAATGISVTDEAVKACQKKSVDIKTHRARPVSAEIVDNSDIIFVMSENHRFCVNAFGREVEARCFLLDKNGDIADPIGGGQDAYDRCCELIEKAVQERLSELNL
jgi:protein-tyrosine-phosphatase